MRRNFEEFCKWVSATPEERRELRIYLAFLRLRAAIEEAL